MIRAIIVLLLAACSTTHALALHKDEKLSDVEHAEVKGEEHDGAWTLTTTTEEYANADVPAGDGGRTGGGLAGHVPADEVGPVGGLPVARVLVKRTVAVEEHAPRDLAWQASSDGFKGVETTTDLKSEDTMKPAGGCMLGLGFWGAVAIAGVLAVGIGILKLKARAKALLP